MRPFAALRGLALTLAVASAACSTGTNPDVKPTRADISLSGSTTVPLQLVVSTDFFETWDPVNAVRAQVFNHADTFLITSLPYDRVVQLNESGSVVVDVSNPSVTEATVRLRVELDSGQPPYDQTGVMSEGGALRFVFSYFSPTL